MFFLLVALTVLSMAGLIGGAYGINGLLAKQAKTLADLKSQAQTLSQQQQGLTKAKQDVAKYAPLEKITEQIVPQDKDQAEAVREIVNIAANAGVSLSSISFPASSLGATGTGSTGAAPAAGSTSPQAAASAKPTLSQLTAVPNIPGVYQLQITLQNDSDTEVSYNQFYNFLSGLENNRRTAEVSNIIIQPDSKNRNLLTFTLTLSEYIKPS
jgi:hypothetical protein